MSYQDIKLDIDDRNIATVTLDRQEKHNAMGTRMMRELHQVCDEINANSDIRAVVLTGAGERSFSAGADLGWMKENFEKNREERIQESSLLAQTLEAFNTLNKITIARINGQAYAGAVGLICVCDIAISVGADSCMTPRSDGSVIEARRSAPEFDVSKKNRALAKEIRRKTLIKFKEGVSASMERTQADR